MLLRVGKMRGVNLAVFDFDYDLQWMGFFLDGDEQVLGRYGGRAEGLPHRYRNLDGLRDAMSVALAQHGKAKQVAPLPPRPPQHPEDFPAGARHAPQACIHCHHVYDFRREWLTEQKLWSRDDVWVYPPPEKIGLTLANLPGNKVAHVVADSPAAGAGLRIGDRIEEVHGIAISAFADLQYALHRSPQAGKVRIAWTRDGKSYTAELTLPAGWKQYDLSWRRSLRELEPASGLHGDDLSADEKRELGLPADALAFRQGNFLSPQARRAGIQQNDIVIAIDGRQPRLSARQFDAMVRLTYEKGDTVVVTVLRQGKRLDLKMTLAP